MSFGEVVELKVVSQCFAKAVDTVLVPVEESVECVCPLNQQNVSACQSDASQWTQCTTCNCLSGEQEGLCILSGA
eukprot:12948346-Ditylum_brightwellii.AAC.1